MKILLFLISIFLLQTAFAHPERIAPRFSESELGLRRQLRAEFFRQNVQSRADQAEFVIEYCQKLFPESRRRQWFFNEFLSYHLFGIRPDSKVVTDPFSVKRWEAVLEVVLLTSAVEVVSVDVPVEALPGLLKTRQNLLKNYLRFVETFGDNPLLSFPELALILKQATPSELVRVNVELREYLDSLESYLHDYRPELTGHQAQVVEIGVNQEIFWMTDEKLTETRSMLSAESEQFKKDIGLDEIEFFRFRQYSDLSFSIELVNEQIRIVQQQLEVSQENLGQYLFENGPADSIELSTLTRLEEDLEKLELAKARLEHVSANP